MTLEVAHHKGDPTSFESALAVVDGFVEDGGAPCKLTDFCFDLSPFFFPLLVADDLGVGLPVGQLIEGFCKGIEPCGWPTEQLKELGPHRVGQDA